MADRMNIKFTIQAVDRFSRVMNNLERKLDAVQRKANAMDMTQRVKIDADTEQASNQLDKLRDKLKRLGGRDAEVEISADTSEAISKIKRVKQTVDQIDDAKVKVNADTDDAVRSIKRVNQQMDSLDDAKVDVDANTSKVFSKLQRVRQQLNELTDEKISVDADTGLAMLSLSRVERKIKEIRNESRRPIMMIITANFLEFRSKMDRLATSVRNIGEILGGMVRGSAVAFHSILSPAIASSTGMLGSLGVMIGVTSGATFGLVTSFAAAGFAAGGFAAVAIPVMKDLFDHMADLTKANGAYEKALREGNAKAAAKHLAEYKRILASMTEEQVKAMEATERFKGIFTSMSDALEPGILTAYTSGLDNLAMILANVRPMIEQTVGVVNNLMDALNRNLDSAQMHAFFDFLNTYAAPALETMVKAVGNFMQGLFNMFVAFAPLSVDMQNGFLRMSEGFRNWSAALSESSAFQSFVDYTRTHWPMVKQIIGDTIMGIIATFTAFAPYASDWMQRTRDMAQSFREFAENLGNNQQFQEFIGYIRANAPAVTQLIGNIINTLVQIGIAMAPVGAAMLKVANHILEWIINFRQAHPVLSSFITGLVSFAGAFVAVLAPILFFKGVFSSLISVFQLVFPWIARIGMTLLRLAGPVGIVVSLVIGLAIAIYQNWGTIGPWIANLWNNVKAYTVAAWQLIKAAVSTALASVAQWVATKFAQIRSTVMSAGSAIRTAVTTAFNAVRTVISTVFTSAVAIVVSVMSAIRNAISTGFNAARAIVSSVISAIRSVITSGFNAARSVVTSVISAIRSTIQSGFSAARSIVSSVISSIRSVIQSGFNAARSVVTSVISSIRSTIQSGFNAARSIVSSVISAIRSTITSGFNAARSAVSSAISSIRSLVQAGFNQVRATISSVMSSAIQAVRTAFNNMVSAVRGALSNVRSAVTSGMNAVLSYLRGINLASIGRQMIQGLANGIKSMAGSVLSAAKGVVKGAIDGAKALLKIKSPSRVFMQIGDYVGQGFVKGIKGTSKQVSAAGAKMAGLIEKAFKDKSLTKTQRAQLTNVKKMNELFVKVINQSKAARERSAERLKAANKKLEDALKLRNDFAKSVKDKTLDFGSIMKADKASTAEDIAADLAARLQQIRQFHGDINKLSKAGLNNTSLQELVEAGVEGGSKTANLLANAGGGVIKQINSTQKEINKSASALSKSTADKFFGLGVDAAKGLVKGLEWQTKALEQSAINMADKLVGIIKKRLQIKSPSRVFFGMGVFVGQGLEYGITSKTDSVVAAVAKLSDGMTKAFNPELEAQAQLAEKSAYNGYTAAAAQYASRRAEETKARSEERRTVVEVPVYIKGREVARASNDEHSRMNERASRRQKMFSGK